MGVERTTSEGWRHDGRAMDALTRRGFLIIAASLAGGWTALGRALPAWAEAAPHADLGVEAERITPDHPASILQIVDDRLAPDPMPIDLVNADVIRLDGDAGALWHRVLCPLLDRVDRADRATSQRRVIHIHGFTSHADWFVLSTLAAAYPVTTQSSMPGPCASERSTALRDARRVSVPDTVAWQIKFGSVRND